ncbi:MAG: CHAT domain-containing protein [Hormoscilla sp.]
MNKSKISFTLLLTLLTAIGGSFPVSDWGPFGGQPVLAQSQGDRKAEADRLFQQGMQQFEKKEYQGALQSFQQARVIYREISEGVGFLGTTIMMGNAHTALGETKRAIEIFEGVIAIAKKINNQELEKVAQQGLELARSQRDLRKAEAERLFDRAVQQLQSGELQGALQSGQAALQIYRNIGDRGGEAEALLVLGSADYFLGQHQRSIELFEQSLEIAREIKNRRGEAAALGNIARVYISLRQYQQAIESYQQAIAINRILNDRAGVADSLRNMGAAYSSLGQYQQSIEFTQQSLAIYRELGDRKEVAGSLNNLGAAYLRLGQSQQGAEFIRQSLAIYQEIGDPKGDEADSWRKLALIYDDLEEYANAIDAWKQTILLAAAKKDFPLVQDAVYKLGNAYYYLGQYSTAIFYLEQTLESARKRSDRADEADSLNSIGNVYYQSRDYSQAIDYYQQSLEIWQELGNRSMQGRMMGNIGLASIHLGDYERAIEFLEKDIAIARELNKQLALGQALGSLGTAYLFQGKYDQALKSYQESLSIARQVNYRRGEGLTLSNIGLALQESGQLPEAEQALLDSINILESLREQQGDNDAYQVSFFEQQARTYFILQEVLIAQNKIDRALEISERGRARAFVKLLARRVAPDDHLQSGAIAIDRIKQIAKEQNATIVQYSRVAENFEIEGKKQGKESELYIWVIKPTGEIEFRKADLKPLWQDQDTFLAKVVAQARCFGNLNCQQSLTTRNFNLEAQEDEALITNSQPQNSKLQQLHQLLIDPIADLLPKDANARVIFVPQDSLFLVPFPALQDEAGKYLIEKHTILTAPSIQVLDLTHKQRRATARQNSREVLVVGNPTMPKVSPFPGEAPQQLSPLPGAEKEAKEIARMFNSKALIGSQATESAIVQKMEGARIIHLATHGSFDPYRGIGSWIALASEGENDGLLRAEEILDLKLKAELVVLSACDTGRGIITGDGVIGLSRSFISAGVPTVLVSLWKVPDNATQELMTEFYNNWQKSADKAQALRQAMLTAMKKYPDAPENWAAFTLIGEAE